MTNEGCAICGTEDAGRIDPDQSPDICVDCLHARAEGMEDFRIESHERGDELRSLIDVADDLRGVLRDMAALVRIGRGEGSAADFERLEIEPDADDPMDAVSEYVDSWALNINASKDRVWVLLAAGGPHITLDILREPSGAVEEVIYRRSWGSAHDRAWTTDGRALGIVGDFLDLIGC